MGKFALQMDIFYYNAFVVKTRFSKRDKYVNAQNREVRKMTLQMWKYQMNEGELQICVKSWSSQ